MSQQAQEKKTIFVGNIPTNITAEQLHSTFSPFGSITDIQIPIDSQNHTNRNFAFISFNAPTEALDAIDNMHLNVIPAVPHKILKVNMARNHQSSSSTNGRQNGHPGKRAIWDDEEWIKKNALKEDANLEDQPKEAPLQVS